MKKAATQCGGSRGSRNNSRVHTKGLMEQVKDSGCLMSKKVVITMERTPMFVAALSTIAKTWKHPKKGPQAYVTTRESSLFKRQPQ